MRSGQVTIVNKLGLHARAASKFVNLAASFASSIEIGHEEPYANGKSIMNVMILAAAKGTELTLVTEGEDEDEAFEAIAQLIADRFGEAE